MTDDTQHQAELHESFRAMLAQRRQQVIDQWNELRNLQWNSGGVQLLRKWMYEIAEGGSTFGYLGLEEHARELLHRLNGVIGGAARSMDVIAGIAASVERLKIQIDRVLAMEPAKATEGFAPVAASKALPPLIHIVDHDAESVELLAAMLSAQNYRVQVFADAAAEQAAAAAEAPTLLLCAGDLPDSGAVAGAAPRSQRPAWVAASFELDAAIRQRAFKAGAVACLGKPVHLPEALTTLRQASTGGLAREALALHLEAALAAATLEGPFAALVYLALDKLVDLHARHGLAGCQEVQASFEGCVARQLDGDDVWCPLGTGVIALLLASRSLQAHRDFLANLARAVAANPFNVRGEKLGCTASAIVSPVLPTSGSVSELLLRAREAVSAIGQRGGNSYRFIDRAPRAARPEPNAAAASPAPAHPLDDLPVDRLALHLQHTVNDQGAEQSIFDVLVRLRDEHGELLPARSFLPDFEAKGLDGSLDLWVIRAAIEHIKRLPAGTPGVELAVRLSAASIGTAMFLPMVKTLIATLPKESAGRLVFQIDETWLALHEKAGFELVLALRDLGCGVMLSNFGHTGHPRSSAWASWFDYAKLAPSKLETLENASEARRVMEAMIRDAITRGARIVACQIEKVQVMTTLSGWGVRLFQGKIVGL